MPKIDEFQIQRAFCTWFKGTDRVPGARLPDVECWSTPNGGTRRDGFEGKRLNETGMEKGMYDVFAFRQGRLYGIEFKASWGKTSPAQDAVHARMIATGIAGHIVTDSVRAAALQVVAWGLVRPGLILPPFAC